MTCSAIKSFQNRVNEIKDAGLYKNEYLITGPQGARVNVDGRELLNMCANNYLGLSGHPDIVKAAQDGMDKYGYGMSSVRFICGTQDIHCELEEKLAEFLSSDDTILYSSCFDANGGLFETLLGSEDAIISDELNHASIIDGVRLCKAKRFRYKNRDIADLEAKLQEASDAKIRLIATDGIFSMDGSVAPLREICDLADKYDALVMIDDSHAVGFFGDKGHGTPEYCGVEGRIDIITGTLGKALGGASGGYTAGRQDIIDLLRQRSRPYLFSNSLAPGVVCASLKALELAGNSNELRSRLRKNTAYFREQINQLGLDVVPGDHPIVPIMLYDAVKAQQVSAKLLELGVYAIGFFYPVVPQGKARIRTQISAAHTREDLDFAIKAFKEAVK
jgi:glycine C-acetyltransferase